MKMKTKSRRKWLALFMALVMLISTVSVTAFAEKQTFNGASAASLNEENAAVTVFQDNERPTIIASDPNATSTTSSEDSESLPPPSVVVATVSDSTIAILLINANTTCVKPAFAIICAYIT